MIGAKGSLATFGNTGELGIPFGITVDFQSLLDNSVTLRDRDSMAQVRVSLMALTPLVLQLVAETITWSTVMTRYRVVSTGLEDDEEEEEEGAKEGEGKLVEKVAAVSTACPVVVQYSTRGTFSRPNPLFVSKN